MISPLEARKVLMLTTLKCSVCKLPINPSTTAWQYPCEPCSRQTPGGGNVWLAAHLQCYDPEGPNAARH